MATFNTFDSVFNVFHADHGIKDTQMSEILFTIEKVQGKDGFFIHQVCLGNDTVPCGLYGPAMGDEPVLDSDVEMVKRSEDRPLDRMIKAPFRPVNYVQVIGIKAGNEFKIFTVYGGPLAPRNPADPSLQTDAEKKEAKEFWAVHALAR